MLNSKVVEMSEVKDGIKVKIEDKDGKTTEQTYNYVLMSIGRKPETMVRRGSCMRGDWVRADNRQAG